MAIFRRPNLECVAQYQKRNMGMTNIIVVTLDNDLFWGIRTELTKKLIFLNKLKRWVTNLKGQIH